MIKLFGYVSAIAIPLIIVIVILYGVIEKKQVFDLFLEGAKTGITTTVKILPTMIGLFVAIGLLRESGLIEMIADKLYNFVSFLKIPKEVMSLAILRPISGSASMGMATDILKTYDPDSFIGLVASTIMGATETTLYTIAVYSASVGIKKTRFVLIASLAADFVGIIASVIIWRMLS